MVRTSYGKRRGTRYKLSLKKRRSKTITRFLEKFKTGENVHIIVTTNNMIPHQRFHGLTGKIVEKRGSSYIVRVRDKNAYKKVVVRPEHLRRSA